jgi:isopentenyl phosphate kinase
MTNLFFIKFGGSVITNKQEQERPDLGVIRRLAEELNRVRLIYPAAQFVVGHGSGSFGHQYAARYGIHEGLQSGDDWMGFALTSDAALRLNRIVVEPLLSAGVPALSLQPSATLVSSQGEIVSWQTDAITLALGRQLVPVIHGDVAFDTTQGCAIISTETLFRYLALATPLTPTKIIIVGEQAVYTADPRTDPTATPIPLITKENIDHVRTLVSGSHGVDVTGGMRTKVEMMWSLVEQTPGLEVHLIGSGEGVLARALSEPLGDSAAGSGGDGNNVGGTRIRL